MNKLITTTAIIAAFATPTLAQSTDATATTEMAASAETDGNVLTRTAKATVDAAGNIVKGTADAATSLVLGTVDAVERNAVTQQMQAEGYLTAESSTFIDNSVISSDEVRIGTVTDVYVNENEDAQRLRIAVEEEAGVEASDFWITLDTDASAATDGTLILPMTSAEVDAELNTENDSDS